MCAADEMTELDQIESRCCAATPGPWESYVVGRDTEAGLNCIATGDGHLFEVIGASVADQDFIAAAREDVPRLIAEIRHLQAELRALQSAGADEEVHAAVEPSSTSVRFTLEHSSLS